MRLSVFVVLFTTILAACGGAGPYGHAPEYAQTSDESRQTTGTKEYDPVMAQRKPDEWRTTPTALFGVVTGRTSGKHGAAYLTLSVRRLAPRNLCANANDRDTCRVTVSDQDFGVVHAEVLLSGEDDVGEHSVGSGSLVRLVGTVAESPDPGDGSPVVKGRWYRHWPRGFYVTQAASEVMRQ